MIFVNWKNNTISNEFWVKRIVKTEYTPWPLIDKGILQQKIYDCDGIEYVRVLSRFASKYNVNLKYHLFKESNRWNDEMPIVSVIFNNTGEVSQVTEKDIRFKGGYKIVIWRANKHRQKGTDL